MKFPYTEATMKTMIQLYHDTINNLVEVRKLSQKQIDKLDDHLLDLQGMFVASTPIFGKVCFNITNNILLIVLLSILNKLTFIY